MTKKAKQKSADEMTIEELRELANRAPGPLVMHLIRALRAACKDLSGIEMQTIMWAIDLPYLDDGTVAALLEKVRRERREARRERKAAAPIQTREMTQQIGTNRFLRSSTSRGWVCEDDLPPECWTRSSMRSPAP